MSRGADDESLHPDESSGQDSLVSGAAVLDLRRTARSVVAELEPAVDVRTADDWGGTMGGTLELHDTAVVWVPGQHARSFGFVEIRVPSEDVVDIRVQARAARRGEVDIDLTDRRTVVVRVPDPERWQDELDRLVGA